MAEGILTELDYMTADAAQGAIQLEASLLEFRQIDTSPAEYCQGPARGAVL